MANKFKVGDVVCCIQREWTTNNRPFQFGKECTVINLDGDGDPMFANVMGGEYSHSFELVRSAGSPAIAQRIEALAQGVRVTPEVHCACCHIKAPRILAPDHSLPGNILREPGQVNQPNLAGWLIMTYPFNDWYGEGRYMNGGSQHRFGVPFSEVTKVCPRCAPQVMGTVKHMSEGWRK